MEEGSVIQASVQIEPQPMLVADAWVAGLGLGSSSAVRCLTEEQVLQFVGGTLPMHEIHQLDAHLNGCPICSQLLVETLRLESASASSLPTLDGRCWTFHPGARVSDRFVILRPLGRGGMGDVYEARDLVHEQLVALKTTRAEHCDDRREYRRLRSEFRLARRIAHPNVCRVREMGIHREVGPRREEIAYFSMDLIVGQCLAEKIRGEALASDEARLVTRELFAGVSAIHDAGVVHRDIKSHNVMLRRGDGRALVIVDFGLAVEVGSHEHGTTPRNERSSVFSVEGSPAYMAPEQLRGDAVTPATDVFACGVVVFEALTGELPFRSLRANGRAPRRDANETPLRLAELMPSVSHRLDAFVARCLELDPASRYGSAGIAANELERLSV
jgi:eukaryotic-like serine/threonine-protein kinase